MGIDFHQLSEIACEIDYRYDFENSVKKLREIWSKKKLKELAFDIPRMEDFKVEDITTHISDTLMVISEQGRRNIKSISDNITELIDSIEYNSSMEGLVGIGTGLTKIDEHTGGFQRGDLVVIAGETSQGKTSLALTIAKNASILHKASISIFSLEMSIRQLTARLVSQEVAVPSKKMLQGKVKYGDISLIKSGVDKLRKSRIFIDECLSTNIDYIINTIKAYKIQKDIDMVVVDYLQLIHNNKKGGTKEQEVGDSIRRLKNIARELDIVVVVLSQLHRSGNGEPTLSRLRDSGQIEEAADVVIFVYRPEVYGEIDMFEAPFSGIDVENKAKIIFAKGRNIGLGSCLLHFNKELTKFDNLTLEVDYEKDNSVPY